MKQINEAQIEVALLQYHKEYETDKENLNYAKEGIKQLLLAESEHNARTRDDRDVSRDDRNGDHGCDDEFGRTLAKNIRGTLIRTGEISLTGTTIESVQDLAELMQIYRNPNFETTRRIYMKGNQIVGIEGVSCQLPHISKIFTETHMESAYQNMIRKMKQLGADGYYLAHNHPSGDVQPSVDDVLSTSLLKQSVPGFRGHIITNHTKYGLIDVDASISEFAIPQEYQIDTYEITTGNHSFLNQTIDSPDMIAIISKILHEKERSCVLFFTDVNKEIKEVREISNELAAKADFKEYLKDTLQNGYHAKCFLYTTSLELFSKSQEFVEQAYLDDVVCKVERGYVSAKNNGMKRNPEIRFAGMTDAELPVLHEVEQPKFYNKTMQELRLQIQELKQEVEQQYEK